MGDEGKDQEGPRYGDLSYFCGMKICLIYNVHPTGCSLYRLELPHAHLSENYPEFDFYSISDLTTAKPKDLASVDVFVVNRYWIHSAPEYVKQIADALRGYGAKLVLDLDDYWVLESGHPFFEHYTKQKTADCIREHIRLADAVTCTTDLLADKIRPMNQNVHVLPNAPFLKYAQYSPDPGMEKDLDKLKFGWFGAAQHQEDFAIIQDPMERLAFDSSLDGRYKIYLGGWAQNEVFFDYEKVMSGNGRNKNYGRINAADVYSYVTGYNFINVALAPLRDTTFNRYKSELKVIEAGYMGKTIIASDMHPYHDVIKHGETGFLIPHSKPKLWYQTIRDLVNNPEQAKAMGQALQKDMISRFHMDEINVRRAELYRSLKRES